MLHHYEIHIIPRNIDDRVILGMDREKLTKREFDTVLHWMFEMACRSIDYRNLRVDAYRDNEHIHDGVGSMRMYTIVSGSDIDAYMFVEHRLLRRMNIAC